MKLEPPHPLAIVIFGASGDLARRKLLPAIFHLCHEGLLPGSYAVVGYGRTEMDDDGFREHVREAIEEFGRVRPAGEPWEEFAARLAYVRGGFEDEGDFDGLRSRLEVLDAELGTEGRRLFYSATPPTAYPHIVRRIGEAGLQANARIVIEKPYGTGLEGARDLDRLVHEVFDEDQVFRIDHYLGKDSVQNILVLRFANALFEPMWDRRYVDHVQLTVAEDIGIEGRGRFYEQTGAIRDMVQTHLLQVLTFITMEPPGSFEAERLRDEKVKVLRAMRPVRPEDVVRGQYAGYRDEPKVSGDSDVDTFVALRLEIDNWRWAGVPFFLRTGKRMARKQLEATIVFRDVPHMVFEGAGLGEAEPNRLVLRFQPQAGISLHFVAQRPGLGIALEPASLEFDYHRAVETPLVEAYELLLHEAMRGDQTLFTRQDGVERAWEVLQPVLDDPAPPAMYEPGSWGPEEADALIAPRRWRLGDPAS